MVEQSRHAGSSQRGESENQIIEPTIPVKKPAADLATDEFFEGTSYRPIHPTGALDDALAGRVEGIHVIGGLHGDGTTIDRLVDAIVRYRPDIVAVEACWKAISQRHPDWHEPQWPPENEVEAACFAARYTDGLSIAGIDLPYREGANQSGDDAFVKADVDIFTEFGLIDSPDDLSRETYYELDRGLVREWRDKTRDRIPELFERVFKGRDDAMAGRLYELYHRDGVESVVAVVGVQHLTGILDRLQAPNHIPDTRFECPTVYTYELGEITESCGIETS